MEGDLEDPGAASPFNSDADVVTVLALYDSLLGAADDYSRVLVTSGLTSAALALDQAYLHAVKATLDLIRALVDFGTHHGAAASLGASDVARANAVVQVCAQTQRAVDPLQGHGKSW